MTWAIDPRELDALARAERLDARVSMRDLDRAQKAFVRNRMGGSRATRRRRNSRLARLAKRGK